MRTLTCAGCGTQFTCDLSAACWCAAAPVKLPLPADADDGDCLCPNCLQRKTQEFLAAKASVSPPT